MKQTERIAVLLFLYTRDELSIAEHQELKDWRSEHPENEKLFFQLTDPVSLRAEIRDYYQERDRDFEQLKQRIPELSEMRLSGSIEAVADLFSDPRLLQEMDPADPFQNEYAETGLSPAAYWESLLAYPEITDEKETDPVPDIKTKPIPSNKKKKRSMKRKIVRWTAGTAATVCIGIMALYVNMFFTPEPAPGRFAVIFGATGLNREKKDDFDRGYMDGFANIEKTTTAKGEPLSIFPDHPKKPKDFTYTLETKTGHQFILRLPDGTQVWMGTQSSIQFPANFSQDTIRVTISGEAYFEMPANAKHQLFVRSADSASSVSRGIQVQTKEALFMFRANPGEPVSVQMIQGSASVRQESGIPDSVLNLQANQQAILNDGKLSLAAPGDTSELLALKNGELYMKEASLQEILKIVARWYYIGVNNSGLATDKKFTLRVPLGSDLSVIIDSLNQQGAHLTLFRKTIAASETPVK